MSTQRQEKSLYEPSGLPTEKVLPRAVSDDFPFANYNTDHFDNQDIVLIDANHQFKSFRSNIFNGAFSGIASKDNSLIPHDESETELKDRLSKHKDFIVAANKNNNYDVITLQECHASQEPFQSFLKNLVGKLKSSTWGNYKAIYSNDELVTIYNENTLQIEQNKTQQAQKKIVDTLGTGKDQANTTFEGVYSEQFQVNVFTHKKSNKTIAQINVHATFDVNQKPMEQALWAVDNAFQTDPNINPDINIYSGDFNRNILFPKQGLRDNAANLNLPNLNKPTSHYATAAGYSFSNGTFIKRKGDKQFSIHPSETLDPTDKSATKILNREIKETQRDQAKTGATVFFQGMFAETYELPSKLNSTMTAMNLDHFLQKKYPNHGIRIEGWKNQVNRLQLRVYTNQNIPELDTDAIGTKKTKGYLIIFTNDTIKKFDALRNKLEQSNAIQLKSMYLSNHITAVKEEIRGTIKLKLKNTPDLNDPFSIVTDKCLQDLDDLQQKIDAGGIKSESEFEFLYTFVKLTKNLAISPKNKAAFTQYKNVAVWASGETTLAGYIGRAALVTAGLVLIATSIALTVVSFGTASPISIAGMCIGFAGIAAGVMGVAAGSAFLNSYKDHGLFKTMEETAEIQEEQMNALQM